MKEVCLESVYVSLCAHACRRRLLCTYKDQKRVLNPLETELQVISEFQTPGLMIEQQLL